MSKLNKEQLIKALECCKIRACDICPYDVFSDPTSTCNLKEDAIELIKELTEENEYLKQQNEIYAVLNEKMEHICESYAFQYGTAVPKEVFLKKERERTIREMQERLKKYYHHLSGKTLPAAVEYHIDQIANEMLQENK